MIKIIEEGKKEFTITCTRCGCKFSYQLEDLGKGDSVTLYPDEKIQCPCCKEWLMHPNQAPKEPTEIKPMWGYVKPIPTNLTTKNINSDEGFEFTTVTRSNYTGR